MKVKLLKEKLLSYADLPVEDIKEKLEQFFNDWKGDKEQIDDVSLIFIKV
jgi:predicted Zn-dependent peptidase